MAGTGADPTTAALTWTRARRTSRGPAPGLDRIVTAGIELADAEGLGGVTMRRVADHLGSGTTSLYRSVDSRDELLDLMVDQALGEALPAVAFSGRWRRDLDAVARGLRQVLLAHPWLSAELAGRPALGPHGLGFYESALTAAVPLTSNPTLLAGIVDTVTAFIRGATAGQIAEAQAQRRTGLTEQQWRAAVGPYVQQVIDTGRFPRFARVVQDGDDLDHDQRFDLGLACVLDGIAARTAE